MRSPFDGSRRPWLLPLVLALGFLLLQVALAPQSRMYPDTARYAELALQYRGVPAEEAHGTVLGLLCADQAEQVVRDRLPGYGVDPARVEQGCREAQADYFVPTDDPRYQAIFETRLGYPAVVAALSPVVGLKPALVALPVLATALAGVVVFGLLRRTGLPAPLAAAGQVMLYVLPIGWWGTQMLTEGPVLLGTVLAVAGVVATATGAGWRGPATLATALLLLGVVKSSSGALLAVSLVAAAAGGWLLDRERRRRWLVVGGVSGAGAVALVGVPAALGWPGLQVSLQDLLTGHFRQPDVADVVPGWLGAIKDYLIRWPAVNDINLALLAGGLVGAWALWRWHRPLALGVYAAAAAAAGGVLIHPSLGEAGRIYALGWLLVVCGLPAAARLLGEGRTGAPQVRTATDTEPSGWPAVSDARGR